MILPFDAFEKRPDYFRALSSMSSCKYDPSHVVGSSVSQDIIQRVSLWDILGCFADNNGELNFVIWKVFFWWLGNLRDDHRSKGTNKRCYRFVEKNWKAGLVVSDTLNDEGSGIRRLGHISFCLSKLSVQCC